MSGPPQRAVSPRESGPPHPELVPTQVAGLCLVSHLAASGCPSAMPSLRGHSSHCDRPRVPFIWQWCCVTCPEQHMLFCQALALCPERGPPPTDPSSGGRASVMPPARYPGGCPGGWAFWQLTSEPQVGLLRAQAVGLRGEPLGKGG